MPQLRGAAEQGRIIYLLNAALKEVVLIWIYTHAEFKKRPSNKLIKKMLLEALESGEFFEVNQTSETASEEQIKQNNGEEE